MLQCVIHLKIIDRFVFDDIILDKKPQSELTYRFKNTLVTTPKILERIGQLKNCGGGILATLPIPSPLSLETFDAKRIVILDGVDEVGELGTLLRSACAFDWDAVWITHTCADPFDPVCIRSSQGVMFTLPYRVGSIENALKHARREKSMVKLRLVENGSGKKTFSVGDPNLNESSVPASESVCLLIQKTREDSPKADDFKSLGLEGIGEQDNVMPLTIKASSLMCGIRNRYFAHRSS